MSSDKYGGSGHPHSSVFVHLSVCLSTDRSGTDAVLLHLAASDNLMGCLIFMSDFLLDI